MTRALVVGAGGQDGTFLTRSLEASGVEVLRVTRTETRRGQVPLPTTDILDPAGLAALVRDFSPHEAYYLAAFHHSSQSPALADGASLVAPSLAVNVTGFVNLLEAVRTHRPGTRLFYASSCLAFGDPETAPQNESTPMRPVCPYGISKTAGHHLCAYYRSAYGLFVCSGILYNHESELRPPDFVSQKIAEGAARIKQGLADELVLGDVTRPVDLGAARDFVEAMRAMLAAESAADYVVATGRARPLSDFVQAAFAALDLDWRRYVRTDPSLVRRRRNLLTGDPARLASRTGWRPTVALEDLAASMAQHAYCRINP